MTKVGRIKTDSIKGTRRMRVPVKVGRMKTNKIKGTGGMPVPR